mgnify:FL=1
MYDPTIQPMSRSLGALSNILRKAEDHCTAKGIKPVALLEFRLFPDMLSLIRQVQLSCDFAVRGAARLSGGELPSYPDTETSFEGLQARIAAVQAALAVYDYATFDAAAPADVALPVQGKDMTFSAQQFVSTYCLPQFYFHVTTAYCILRHNGVEIGKKDYMGV